MGSYSHLIGGFNVFKATTYAQKKEAIGHVIRQGVLPTTLFITCADMKIAPDILFSSNPGDNYVFRNIAALIPPYSETEENGIVAAIEYGVMTLNVENIVVMGHAKCNGIKLVMQSGEGGTLNSTYRYSDAMQKWLSIADEARDSVRRELSDKSPDEQQAACEHESVLVSLKNLLTYPFVAKRLEDDSLKIYGWHFNIETGELMGFDPETRYFENLA